MIHPPIPPCDFFKKKFFQKEERTGSWYFNGFTTSDEPLKVRFGFDGFNYKSYWIEIIAAVARCAWIDEADRIEGDVRNRSRDGSGEFGWDDDSRKQYTSAEENANEWRVWGEINGAAKSESTRPAQTDQIEVQK